MRVLTRPAAYAALISLLLLLAGCGGGSSNPEVRDPSSQEPHGLVARSAGGAEAKFDQAKVECVPSEYDPDVLVVSLTAEASGARLHVEVVPLGGKSERSYELPIDAGDEENGPANALVYVAMGPDIESSTESEESTGSLVVVQASCDPVNVQLRLDATLASEQYDGEPVTLKGQLALP